MAVDFAAAVVLAYALWHAPWRMLFDNERSHVWWASVGTVAVVGLGVWGASNGMFG